MCFEEILKNAKNADKKAMLEIVEMYRPFMIKQSIVNGRFDEDLYQELVYILLLCIRKFPIENKLNIVSE